MANVLQGLFSDPNEVRGQRMNDIADMQTSLAQLGGSTSGLLGQIAATGNLAGRRMGEGLATAVGLKSPKEEKAAAIQGLMAEMQATSDGAFSLQNPDHAAYFAKKLNDMGLTEEAIKVMEHRKGILSSQLDQNKRSIQVIGQRYDDMSGGMVNVYGYFDPATQKTVEVNVNPQEDTSLPAKKGKSNIGTTAESLAESWKGA